jgi:hypothetical protein
VSCKEHHYFIATCNAFCKGFDSFNHSKVIEVSRAGKRKTIAIEKTKNLRERDVIGL